MNKCICALGLSFALMSAAFADDRVTLLYRYSPGQVLRYEGKRTMTVESTVSGTTQKFVSDTESLREWRVIGIDGKGNARLAMSILRVKVDATESSGKCLKFDAATDGEAGPLASVIGRPLLEVTVSASGQVIEVSEATGENVSSFVANVRTLLFPVPPTPIAIGTGWQ